MLNENPLIVQKVSIIDTIRAIAPGDSAVFPRDILGPYISVYAAITRLNSDARRELYDLDTTNDGSYLITHDRE